MKRLSFNHCSQIIAERSNGWLHLNGSYGCYQLQEYPFQYETTVEQLESGTLKQCMDKFYRVVNTGKYDYLPKHLFNGDKPAYMAGELKIYALVASINKLIEQYETTGKAGLHTQQPNELEGFVAYLEFKHKGAYHGPTSQLGTDMWYYDPKRFDSALRPVSDSPISTDTITCFARPLQMKWDSVEVHGCKVSHDAQGNELVEQVGDEEAEFFTVYLHDVAGGIYSVADLKTRQLAEALADLIQWSAANYQPA